jgi:signal transduction histidine kinase
MGEAKNVPSRGPRFPLGLKLAAALLSAVLLMLAFLFFYFGPHATESFLEGSDGLIGLSRDAMNEMARRNTSASSDLLISLIRHTTDSRRRVLSDMPLSLHGGRVEEIRAEIVRSDAGKSRVLQSNVEILAREMERRSLRDVAGRLDRLGREQAALGRFFAGDIRRSYLVLAGAVFSILVLLLGFGLYQTVVIPLQRLRKATRAVARGDLDLDVTAGFADEVGDLSTDFSTMVQQLRESREDVRQKKDQLERLNRTLEGEVKRKTVHLEQTLDDLRGTQKELVHAEKMASVGTLARGVAHEFNNLIGGIRGCTAEALEEEEDAVRREPLEVVMRAADRAAEITRQLLAFSKQGAITLRPVDMTHVLGELFHLIEPEARKRKVTLLRAVDEGLTLEADGSALYQVVLNLCTNAIQAMPEGGKLTVGARMVAGTAGEGGSGSRELSITVADTGVGIPADQINHIFEPFFTTRDLDPDPFSRGTGLGLSVSYSLVEAHGGRLDVQSEPGVGSVFFLRIPAAKPQEKKNDEPA